MPKKTVSINKFNKGILNIYDKRDIPEGGMSNLTDVLCDISGQLRQMGSEIPITNAIIGNADITGYIEPGYGIFTFDTDYSITTGKEIPTRVLVVQNANAITLFDWTFRDSLTATQLANNPSLGILTNDIYIFGDASNLDTIVRPIYNFIDGTFYISDGNFNNTPADGFGKVGSDYTKEYSYIRKKWFPNAVGFSNPSAYNGAASINNDTGGSITRGKWQSFQSYVFPPSVASDGANTHQLYSATDLKRDSDGAFPGDGGNSSRANLIAELDELGGNITVSIAEHTDEDAGEWMLDDNYRFGISFQYDDGRESLVTNFVHVMPCTKDSTSLWFELYAIFNSINSFDKRTAGINLYYTGDTGGFLDDPLWMGYWHWGANELDDTYFESHEGVRLEADKITKTGDCFSTTGNTLVIDGTDITYAGLEIKTIPTISFEIRNGYNATSDSVAAKYATSVVAQRAMFIGGVQRVRFDTSSVATANSDFALKANCVKQCTIHTMPKNLDRLMYSPVNQFSIFPSDNIIDVAINDGDSITHLEVFNDRILQFKKHKLYIINIATDERYVEGDYDFLGVDKPYQVTKTELGIAWINKLGCYFYGGEAAPIELTKNNIKLISDETSNESKFIAWGNFIKSTGMIGYIPQNKQLIVFEDPMSASSGNILIYDMMTKSWTFGSDRVSLPPKSNILGTLDNTCLYATNKDSVAGGINTELLDTVDGIGALWIISGLNGNITSNTTASYLKIGSIEITEELNFSTTTEINGSITFSSDSSTATNLAEYFAESIHSKTGNDFYISMIPGTLMIMRLADDIDGTYNGNNLTISQATANTALTLGARTITNMKNLTFELESLSGVSTWYNSGWSDAGQDTVTQLKLRTESNAAVTDYASESSQINITTLLHHSSLATFAPESNLALAYSNGAFYNPFNIESISTYAFQQGEYDTRISSDRKLKGVDTINYSTITITGAGNYDWEMGDSPGTTVKLRFGHGAGGGHESVSLHQHYDGWIGNGEWTLMGYPMATDGTTMLAGEDSTFYTNGQPLETGDPLGKITEPGDYNHIMVNIGEQNNTVKVPVVVYRRFSNPNELHISILGDQSNQFSINAKYNIYGGGESGGAIHAQSGGVNDLRKFKLNAVEVYGYPGIVFGGNLLGGHYYENATHTQTSFTVLIFRQDEQDPADISTNEPCAAGKWDSIKSYGDMCIAGNMSFQQTSVTTMVINNGSNNGIGNNKNIALAHPYIIDRSSNHRFFLSLIDDNNDTYTGTYQPTGTDYNAITTANGLVASLLEANPSLYSLEKISIAAPTVAVIQVTGDWVRLRINSDLLDLGIRNGDIFNVRHENDNAGFFSNAIAYGPTKIYKIATIDGYGLETAGYTYLTIDSIAADDILLDEIIVNGTGATLTVLTGVSFDFSTIKATSYSSDEYNQFSFSGGRSASVEFLEYASTKNSIHNFRTSKNLLIETADYDFGSPGNLKKIYHVDISYQYTSNDITNNSLNVSAILNNKSIKIGLIDSQGMPGLAQSSTWITTRLYFHTNKTPIKCTSLRIIIESASVTEISNFKLNDISISSRVLNR